MRRRTLRALPVLGLLLLPACGGGGGKGPATPDPPDRSTVGGALTALEEFYGRRIADQAIGMLSQGYRFHPARPESIPFLGSGETSWDHAREAEILSLLLVEERTSWIDQVLLEIRTEAITPSSDGNRVDVDADVQLEFLIGTTELVQSRSRMTLVFVRDAPGDFFLVEEVESLAINPDTGNPYRELTVGELRARALEDRGAERRLLR